MTAVQAEYVRGLGGWWGGLFMAASKVLGEEVVTDGAGVGREREGRRWWVGNADGDSAVVIEHSE